jgi:hypothetical protein
MRTLATNNPTRTIVKARIDDRRGYLALSGVTFLARSDRRIIHFCTQVGIQEIKL